MTNLRTSATQVDGEHAHAPSAPRWLANSSNSRSPARVRGIDERSYDPRMSLEWEQAIVDARDPVSLGRWWCGALGWVVVNEDPEEFEIRPSADRLPGLLFALNPEPKVMKNRLHLDFRPDDRDAEVGRLLALGATHADVGQGEQSWIVLADPEGNEFCILASRTTVA